MGIETSAFRQFNMKAKIYSAGWCGHCRRAKALLESAQIDYDEIDVDTEDGVDEFRFLMRNLHVRSIPQVFIDEKFIGGYAELKNFLTEQKLL